MKKNLCWIRRDLRTDDHKALAESLNSEGETYVVFIFDKFIIDKLPADDRRITFIIESLQEIEKKLNQFNSSLIIAYGNPIEEIEKIVHKLKINKLFLNRDYEPYAKKRDLEVKKVMNKLGVEVFDFKDHVFYEKHEVVTDKREIYKVFTPYKNKWLTKFENEEKIVPNYSCNLKKLAPNLDHPQNFNLWFEKIHKNPTENFLKGGEIVAHKRLTEFYQYINDYKISRDYPSLEKTSNMSPYIRMGNVSVRKIIKDVINFKSEGATIYLSEIIWREFYQVILDVYPKVEKNCFKLEYDQLVYDNNMEYFEKWKEGNTGYPIVDAAMRCLNATGMMHNRLRMVVASFLTKTLLVDWRLGEEYFAIKLLDFDLAANNGGWQWSASTGVDAQPYFRIFNPYNQSEKFDENGDFIKMWCPELREFSSKLIHFPHEADIVEQARANCQIGKDYPHPIVAYKVQKEKALKMFKEIK
jgi:deoxyribodipyrimidine photo-lyase